MFGVAFDTDVEAFDITADDLARLGAKLDASPALLADDQSLLVNVFSLAGAQARRRNKDAEVSGYAYLPGIATVPSIRIPSVTPMLSNGIRSSFFGSFGMPADGSG